MKLMVEIKLVWGIGFRQPIYSAPVANTNNTWIFTPLNSREVLKFKTKPSRN